jgi:glycosyltransferase involved in cell wall biosynthesis
MISVIVAVYNAEDYLDFCVNSILNQTYKDIQIILVNDGSNDDSWEVCKKIKENHLDKNIKIINKENGGDFTAWNRGVEEADGEYIGFVDNDDYILPQMYEYLLGILESNNADIASCRRWRNIEFLNNFEDMDTKNTNIHVLSGEEAAKHIMCELTYLRPNLGDKLYRKKCFQDLKIPAAYNADFAYNYQAFLFANKIVSSEKELYAYTIREGSMTTSAWSPKRTKSFYEETYGAIEFYKSMNKPDLVNAAVYKHIQVGIGAWEKMLETTSTLPIDFKNLNISIKKHLKTLDFNLLGFSKKKTLKKKIEFTLFAYCPNLLCFLKGVYAKRKGIIKV